MAMGAAGERMQQASWCYRCAEALCWCSVGAAWERMQASWFYRGAEVVRWCISLCYCGFVTILLTMRYQNSNKKRVNIRRVRARDLLGVNIHFYAACFV